MLQSCRQHACNPGAINNNHSFLTPVTPSGSPKKPELTTDDYPTQQSKAQNDSGCSLCILDKTVVKEKHDSYGLISAFS